MESAGNLATESRQTFSEENMKILRTILIALALTVSAFAWNCPTGQIRQQAPAGTSTSTPYYDVVEGIAFICVPSNPTPPAVGTVSSSNVNTNNNAANSNATANSNSASNSASNSTSTSSSNQTQGQKQKQQQSQTATGGQATATGGQAISSSTSTGGAANSPPA